MEFNKITIQANVAGELNKIWDYYTQPEHITKWNFAADDWQCPWATNDLRIGGKSAARMEAKDGSFGFDFETVYTELVIGEKFIAVMEDGRQMDVQFKPSNNEVVITITFDAEKENSEELQRGGWQAILNNFKKYAESH